jgi:opacity protein-like surface antigen
MRLCMHKSEGRARRSVAMIILLIVFISAPAMAVPITLPSGQVMDLTPDQLELLKQQPDIHFTLQLPEEAMVGSTFIELPDALGGGFIVGNQKQLVAGLIAAGALSQEEAKSIRATLARGGMFADIYFGASMPQDEDLHMRSSGFGVVAESTDADVSYDASFTSGIRVGYWSKKRLWLGLAMDVSYFKMDSDKKDITLYPISTLLMLRLPKRRFQPYVGIGPALFVSKMKFTVDLSELSSGGTGTFNDTSFDVGLDARAGLAVAWYGNTGIFAEYRFTHHSAEFDDTLAGVKVDVETDSNTHHFMVGISYRF